MLVVDDSAVVRSVLEQGLSADPALEVVGSAADPYQARDKIVALAPHVLTLDVEMPRMNGLDFLRKLMPQYPLPVVMVSSLTERGKRITLDCLEAGAVDFVTKPSTDMVKGLGAMLAELRTKVKIASTANVAHWKNKRFERVAQTVRGAADKGPEMVVAIGASTGGTEAIREVITKFSRNMPGVVIVQHMPAGFTQMFADRMNTLSQMLVKEAEDGDQVLRGRVLIAPGGKQMQLVKAGGGFKVSVKEGELVNGHCPSVEVLFDSVAKAVGGRAVGVMLTGMGADGADAMARMREAGARTLAQDEESSVVFGMPREAFVRGGAERLVPLTDISQEVMNLLTRKAAQ